MRNGCILLPHSQTQGVPEQFFLVQMLCGNIAKGLGVVHENMAACSTWEVTKGNLHYESSARA